MSSFGGARIVVLKIDPSDVVSIPSDYNNSKGRTAKYQVVDELELQGTLPATKIQDGFSDKYNKKPVVQFPVKPVAQSDDKLLDSSVRYIRKCIQTGAATVAEMAKQFSRSPRTIRRIRDFEAYKDVK